MDTKKKAKARARIKTRVRGRVHGTAERPRLTVFRSNKQIYAQVIDDLAGRTLAAASSLGRRCSWCQVGPSCSCRQAHR